MKQYDIYKELIMSPLIEAGGVVVFIWKNAPNWPVEAVSSNITRLYGYEPQEYISGALAYADQIHPDDLTRVFDEVARASSATESFFTHQPYRYKHKKGVYAWVNDTTTILKDDQGNITHYVGYLMDITQQVRTQETLKEKEKRLAQLLEVPAVGISINKLDGVFIEANQQLLKMLGFTMEELKQSSTWDIMPKAYDDAEKAVMAELMQKGRFGPYEKEYIHKKGHLVNVLVNGVLLTDDQGAQTVWSTTQDITQAKKVEQVLTKAQELGHIGHWSLDLQTNKLTWSDETYRIFGLEPQAFGATYEAFLERIYVDDRDRVNQAYTDSLAKDESYQIEHRIVTVNDELRYVIERCEHLHNNDGSIIGSIGIVLDVTESKLNELALEDAKHKAEAANVAKSSFLASMSHELRTPLNAILGFSKKLTFDENLNELQKKNLITINRAGRHLLDMINDILDMSKIESGEMKVHLDDFDLLKMLDDLSDLFTFQAEIEHLQCERILEDNLPHFIKSDEGKLTQVLVNIIGNAIKFSSQGTITLRAWATPMRGKNQFMQINLSVTDEGEGIDAGMIEQIFQPFIQNNGSKKVQGTGLGLPISRTIATMLGGTLSVESEVGKGSTFTLSFPAELSGEFKAEALLKKEASHPHTNSEIKKMLSGDVNCSALPSTVKEHIYNAAITGSGMQIKKELEEIKKAFPQEYAYLYSLTSNYDFDAIIALFKDL